MLLLLLAMQASDVPQDVNVNVNVNDCPICNAIKLFRGDTKARDRKAVGKMLASGDCVGAEKHALEKGDFALADRVKAYCAQSDSKNPPSVASANWLSVATADDGTAYYTDTESFNDKGPYRSVWERIAWPASNARRETRALKIYKCRDQTRAVKMLVDYYRNGDVRSVNVQERELDFTPFVPETMGEASFRAACTGSSASK